MSAMLTRWRLADGQVYARIAADGALALCVTVLVAAVEVSVTSVFAAVGILPSGAGSAIARRWAVSILWWPFVLALTTITVYSVLGIYSWARGHRLRFKIERMALGCSAMTISWATVLLLIHDTLAIPQFGTVASIAGVFVATSVARLSLRVLQSRGIIQPLEPAQADSAIHSVLIVGGAGYIGSVLCELLLRSGFRVRVLDSLLYGDASLRDFAKTASFELCKGDVRDLTALINAARGVDAIVHLAAIVGDSACELDHNLTVEINVLATRNVKEVATALGVKRLVFASTCSVYGAARDLMDERSETHPVSLYGRTKQRSEEILLSKRSALTTTVLRFATIYGLSYRPRFDLVVNLFAAQAVREGKLTVHGGDQWRPLLHVRDAARAIHTVLQSPIAVVDGQIFNIGSDDENYQIAEIARRVVLQVPEAAIYEIPSRADPRTYRVSFRKAARDLDFNPGVGLDDGIRELVGAVRSFALDYRLPIYSNVRHLSAGNAPLARDATLAELAHLG